jgi:YD repeat-containing protein
MKNPIKKLAVIMLLYPVVIYAQQISVHSPTAANLGLYGEIPVSYYTGIPDISIPLYEIEGKQITVPVGLSYHSAGIRPEIHPGPVGLGWSLKAGGVISRTAKGNSPDESNPDGRSEIVEGYLAYTGGWMAENNWKYRYENTLSSDCYKCRTAVYYAAPYADLEPDEFNFSVLNISGKFYFDHTGQIQVQCDNPVKVIFNNEFIVPSAEGIGLDYSLDFSHRAFKLFTIVDERGTQYHFGGATAIEFSDPISYGRASNGYGIPATGNFLEATSWFLTQIESADGADVINFEYERGPFVCQLYRSFDYYTYSGAGESGSRYNNIAKDGTLISPVYLKRIARVNGEEVALTYTESNDVKYNSNDYSSLFAYGSLNDYKLLEKTSAIPWFYQNVPSNKYDRIKWLKLDAISVKNSLNQAVSQINFIYNNNSSERLFLESIDVYGDETQLTSPLNYTFTYKNRSRLPAQYLTCITDHWGFNNGKTYPASGFNAQNKVTDAYYADSGVLSKIDYPTGGSTQFEYELNDYSRIVSTDNRSVSTIQSGMAGGLRIKKIITDSLSREFFYKETPTSPVSSGVLNVLPQYAYSINGTDCDGKSFTKSVIRSLPVIPLTKDNEGLHIGYSYVCEQVSNGNDGYTQYHYTNHENGHSDTLLANGRWNRSIFPSDPHCSRYFERGRLKKETFYNSDGQAVAAKETVWSRYGSQDENNPRAFLFESVMLGYDYCSSAAYLHYCYKFLPSQKTEIVYGINGQNPVTTVTDYGYNAQNLLSQVTKYGSDTKIRSTKFTYPFQVKEGPDTTIMRKMTEKHVLSSHVRKIDYLGNEITNGEVLKYGAVGSNNQIFKPEEMKLLHLTNPISESQLYSTGQSQSFDLSISSEAYSPEDRDYASSNFYLSRSSRVQMETSFGEYFVDLYSQFSTYAIEIKNIYTNEIAYYWEMRANIAPRSNSSIIFTDFLYADLLPGSYIFKLQHWVESGYVPDPNVSYNAHVYVNITGDIQFVFNHSAIQSEIFYKYDNTGNMIESKPSGSAVPTTYLWGYRHQHPIAEIQNATYDQVKNALGGQTVVDAIANADTLSTSNATLLNNLRTNTNLQGAMVTTYTYKPLIGMLTATDPRGITTYYEYDAFGRLKRTYFIENGTVKTLQQYDYHYKN